MRFIWRIVIATSCVGSIWAFYEAKTNERALFEKAQVCSVHAEQGDVKSQLALANMYYYGQGVPQDNVEAVLWYHKAADQGEAKAQNDLGNMYFHGRGVLQDNAEAIQWYRKASNQGDTKAQFSLGQMYAKGLGVPQDRAEADHWLRKAADMGDTNAQLALGLRWSMFSSSSKNSLLLVVLASLSLLISSFFSRKSSQDQQYGISALAGLFGLLWAAMDFYGYYYVIYLQSNSVENPFSFVKFLLAGIFASMLIIMIIPKGDRLALGVGYLLFMGFNLYAISHYNLVRLAPAVREFYSVNGLLVGMLISAATIFWLRVKETNGSACVTVNRFPS